MCFCLSQIQYPLSPVPGVPLENSFQILDDFGMKCGSASVVEFINHTMLPDRPLNFYLSISAQDSRSLHLLVGAAYTRTLELRRINAYTVTAYNYNWIARLQSQQHFSAWGVWQEDRLLGEMILSANGAEGVIEMIYARPEFRRRGVAAALVGQAAQELLRIGVRAMVADVWQRNDPATQFFDKMHFETTQPVRLYPGINL